MIDKEKYRRIGQVVLLLVTDAERERFQSFIINQHSSQYVVAADALVSILEDWDTEQGKMDIGL